VILLKWKRRFSSFNENQMIEKKFGKEIKKNYFRKFFRQFDFISLPLKEKEFFFIMIFFKLTCLSTLLRNIKNMKILLFSLLFKHEILL